MADLEQERVTALWREAARRLAPAFRPVDPERMLKLDALARANRAEAECGRLREQLAAARQALEKIASGEIVTRSRGLSNAIIDGKSASVEYVEKMSARDGRPCCSWGCRRTGMRPNDYRDQLDALAKAAAEYQEAVRLAGSYPGHEEFVQAEFVEIHGRLDDADVDLADRLVVARAALGVVGGQE